MIFRILAEVAMGARILDRLDDLRPLDHLQMPDLVAELAMALRQHRYLFGTRHLNIPSRDCCPGATVQGHETVTGLSAGF